VTRAIGPFDVSLKPLPMDDDPGSEMLGRMSLEKVFKGRQGSFILQHTGVMNRGEQSLVITIVPDSGSGQLEGIRGTMTIKIEGGKHSYELNYTLGTP